ncbi:MAG: hypothetical protein HKN24_10000 [Acidimicrobiales bacterium]|nr:hypothetical protein [Acidimicrobiales bacterium]
MIDAGTALLIERGYGHGGEQITYRRVFDRIEQESGVVVARAQVHGRIWASQNDFQLDVLAESCKPFVADGLQVAAEAALNAIQSVDRTEPDWQSRAVARAIRDGSFANVEALMASPSWLLGRAIMSFHALSSNRSDRVSEALRSEYEASLSSWTNLFEATAVGLGLRAKPWTRCTLAQVCRIAAQFADVLSDGVVARSRMLGETQIYSVEIAGDERAEWNILGLGAWCVIDHLMEPDPEKESG